MVNVQGDLPTLDPADDRARARAAGRRRRRYRARWRAEITRAEERDNPNVVKVVGTPVGAGAAARALFHPRDRALRATGRSITTSASTPIAARRSSASSALPPSPLEQREKLEQLRALEAGMRIDVAVVDTVPLGVDTPDDLDRARATAAPRRQMHDDDARRSPSRASRAPIPHIACREAYPGLRAAALPDLRGRLRRGARRPRRARA